MSTSELRNTINEHLAHIDDVQFLNALKILIESKMAVGEYKLSEYQVERVKSARKQLFDGATIPNDVLQNEISKWLNAR